MFNGKIPDIWRPLSYPSLKPLGSYCKNLIARIKFFQTWVDEGLPNNFWLPGFHFTTGFLTGVKQNFARKYTIAIDEIILDFKIHGAQCEEPPEDGAYTYGNFIEGCKWNYDDGYLDESDEKILFVPAPIIEVIPIHNKPKEGSDDEGDEIDPTKPFYQAPMYRTAERKGVLSTTGHSTNFVMYVRMPTDTMERAIHWIKRGVALLNQLSS